MSEAWLVDDDAPPCGSRRTAAARRAWRSRRAGTRVLALTVDARAALTAMHARPVTSRAGARAWARTPSSSSADPAIVERTARCHRALRPTRRPAWALLPIARDVGDFGLALVRLDDPPRVDEPVWSMYPNGLDPAPVARRPSAGGSPWAARVGPRDARPGRRACSSSGSMDAERRVHAARDRPHDAESRPTWPCGRRARRALGSRGSTAAGSWVERLVCPVSSPPLRATREDESGFMR